MEKIIRKDDLTLLCERAASFPDGILEAHQKLHARIPFSEERAYFGVSRPENGSIVYRAAAQELNSGEAEKYDCETLVLKKGEYICVEINDYKNNLQHIESTFQKLLEHPEIDPEGYCVEEYLADEKTLRCSVRLTK